MQQQSFDDHLRIANPLSTARRTIYICLLENPFPDDAVLSIVQKYIQDFFRLPVRIIRVSWRKMGLRTRAGRNGFGEFQLSMDDLLKWLQRRVPQDAYCIVAVTTLDLFVPDSSWEYIPGRSHYTQRHGACSYARLKSETDQMFVPCDRGTFVRRCLKLTCHEVAHTFGLKHCSDSTCRMAGTMSLEHHDATHLLFCSDCEFKLQTLLKWSRQDLKDRAKALSAVLANTEIAAEFQAEITDLWNSASSCSDEASYCEICSDLPPILPRRFPRRDQRQKS